MTNLDESLKCEEHEAPFLICNLVTKEGKEALACDFTVICPVDQKIESLTMMLPLNELDDLYLPLSDKIFRCEKCFRETAIEDVAKFGKKIVHIFLSCPEHGRLITREISPGIYDKIRYVWDTKDIKEVKEKTY